MISKLTVKDTTDDLPEQLYVTGKHSERKFLRQFFSERNIALAGIDISTEDSEKAILAHLLDLLYRRSRDKSYKREPKGNNDENVIILKS